MQDCVSLADIRVEWAGRILATSTATFGPKLTRPEHKDAEIVLVEPVVGWSTRLMNGKIVLVERSNVPFVRTVTNAQNAGAIAVVIYNNLDGGPMGMHNNGVHKLAATITIPVVSVSRWDGVQLAAAINTSTTTVSLRNTAASTVADRPGLAQHSRYTANLPCMMRAGTSRNSEVVGLLAKDSCIEIVQEGIDGTDGYHVQGSTRQPDANGFYARGEQSHNGFPVYVKASGGKFLFWALSGRGMWMIADAIDDTIQTRCRERERTSADGSSGPHASGWFTGTLSGLQAVEPGLSVTPGGICPS